MAAREKVPSIFGSLMRDRILTLLATQGSSHLRELARIYGVTVPLVQRTLAQLEIDGLVVARAYGRTRRVELNPRWFAIIELRQLLAAVAIAKPSLYDPGITVRSRPRRSGKPL